METIQVTRLDRCIQVECVIVYSHSLSYNEFGDAGLHALSEGIKNFKELQELQ